MPYQKYFSKAAKKKAGRYVKCGKMVYNDAQKALYMTRQLKSLLNVEYKHHNVQALNSAVTDAGIITNVSLLSQGDSSTTRDGGSVKYTSFRLSYAIGLHASATTFLVRVLVVQDKQTN